MNRRLTFILYLFGMLSSASQMVVYAGEGEPAVVNGELQDSLRKTPRKIDRLFEDGVFSGQFQTEIQYCRPEYKGDPSEYVNRFLSNSFLDINYMSRMLEIGARVEAYENPLPGFEYDYKGAGVPYFFLTLKLKRIQITAGDLYEQFGSGMILRSYYERTLGIDNAIRGGRITVQPLPWLSLKLLAGKQRHYWEHTPAWLGGADVEASLGDLFTRLRTSGHALQWGASMVSKWEPDQLILVNPTSRLNLPKAVSAWSTRLRYQNQSLTFSGEYAYKFNDPSLENNYTYRPGQALALTASYSKPGFGATLGVKHSDNMSMRSERAARGRMLQINYLPSFSYQHTYSLAAMYPYATQQMGEVALQADLFYKIPKYTTLGGKYGTDIRVNFSRINSLDKRFDNPGKEPIPGTYGYRTNLFAIGDDVYYQDANIDITHRFSRDFKMTMMYANQIYNQLQIEGHGNRGDIVYSHIFVTDASLRLSRKTSIRMEAQYLRTKQDYGDWVAALLELSISPSLIFTISDTYNAGESRKNYLLGAIAYSAGAHRAQLSVGQQRAGITCVGGICRYVPATNGVMLSYSINISSR